MASDASTRWWCRAQAGPAVPPRATWISSIESNPAAAWRTSPHDGPGRRVGAWAHRVDDGETFQAVVGVELPGGSGAYGAGADDDGPHCYRRSVPDSSRQPPPFGGTPPVPRRRMTPAIAAAANTAT